MSTTNEDQFPESELFAANREAALASNAWLLGWGLLRGARALSGSLSVNRPGFPGDSIPWKRMEHGREQWNPEEVPR